MVGKTKQVRQHPWKVKQSKIQLGDQGLELKKTEKQFVLSYRDGEERIEFCFSLEI